MKHSCDVRYFGERIRSLAMRSLFTKTSTPLDTRSGVSWRIHLRYPREKVVGAWANLEQLSRIAPKLWLILIQASRSV